MSNSYLVLDLETTDNSEHGRVGNFYYGKILAVGMKNQSEQRSEYLDKPLLDLKIDEEVLVGHNIKFDLLHLWKFPGVQEWIRNGGRIHDTAYAEFLISGQTHKYPKLRDIAGDKYGCPERVKYIDRMLFDQKDTIKQLSLEFEAEQDPFKKGSIREEIKYISGIKSMIDVPRRLVIEDVTNDVLDTEQVYLKQLAYIVQYKMEGLIEIAMDSLLATTEMEFNGFKVNQEILQNNKKQQQVELDKVSEDLNKLISEYWK